MKIKNFFTKRHFIQIGILILAALIMLVLNHSILFLRQTPPPEHYLSVEDYALHDPSSGERIFPQFTNQYYYSILNSTNSQYKTTRGIGVGDSWEDFVKAYGDVYAARISGYKVQPEGSNAYEGFHETFMTVNEFNQKYFQSGEMDLSQVHLDVSFSLYTQLLNPAYTKESQDALFDRYYSATFYLFDQPIRLGQLRLKELALYFSFQPNEKEPAAGSQIWYLNTELY